VKNLSQKFKIAFLLLVLFMTPIMVFAQSEAGVLFLLIEPGSRPGAMGQSYVSMVNDGFAQFWNTGAMAFNRKDQIAMMHTNWLGDIFDDMYYEFLGWNRYYEELQGNLGFQVTFLTLGQHEITGPDGELLGFFSAFDIAAGATYGYQISDNMGAGIGFKFIYSDLAPGETYAGAGGGKGRGISYAFDLGFMYKNIFKVDGLNWGVNIQNIGPNITYIDEEQSDPLPMNFRTGLSYKIFEDDLNSFIITGDLNKLLANDDFVLARLITAWYDDGGFMSKRERDTTIFGAGAEYTYWNLLSLRAGWMYDKGGEIIGPSFGVGIQYTFQERYRAFFDFAFQQGGELVDFNKTFSLGIEF